MVEIVQFNTITLFKRFVKLLFRKHAFNYSKVTENTFIMLQKVSFVNKCCSFELSIHQHNRIRK